MRNKRVLKRVFARSGMVLAVVLSTGLAASMVALSSSGTPELTAAGDPCGTSGVLNGTTCTYDTVGSDSFTVPAGVGSVEVTVVGAQGGTTSSLVMPRTVGPRPGTSPGAPVAAVARRWGR